MSQHPVEVSFDKACDAPVGNRIVFRCVLSEKHRETDEPHYAPENESSVRLWRAWKSRQASAAVAEMQPHEHVFENGTCTAPGCKEVQMREVTDIRLHEVVMGGRIPVDYRGPVRPPAADAAIDTWNGEPIVPTKQREGDQQLPDGDASQPDIQSLVIADIEERRQVGISRYGQALQPFNGRNTLKDLYEELMDATIYTKSLLVMAEAEQERLIGVVRDVLIKEGVGHETADFDEIAPVVVARILDAVSMSRAPRTASIEVCPSHPSFQLRPDGSCAVCGRIAR